MVFQTFIFPFSNNSFSLLNFSRCYHDFTITCMHENKHIQFLKMCYISYHNSLRIPASRGQYMILYTRVYQIRRKTSGDMKGIQFLCFLESVKLSLVCSNLHAGVGVGCRGCSGPSYYSRVSNKSTTGNKSTAITNLDCGTISVP